MRHGSMVGDGKSLLDTMDLIHIDGYLFNKLNSNYIYYLII